MVTHDELMRLTPDVTWIETGTISKQAFVMNEHFVSITNTLTMTFFGNIDLSLGNVDSMLNLLDRCIKV